MYTISHDLRWGHAAAKIACSPLVNDVETYTRFKKNCTLNDHTKCRQICMLKQPLTQDNTAPYNAALLKTIDDLAMILQLESVKYARFHKYYLSGIYSSCLSTLFTRVLPVEATQLLATAILEGHAAFALVYTALSVSELYRDIIKQSRNPDECLENFHKELQRLTTHVRHNTKSYQCIYTTCQSSSQEWLNRFNDVLSHVHSNVQKRSATDNFADESLDEKQDDSTISNMSTCATNTSINTSSQNDSCTHENDHRTGGASDVVHEKITCPLCKITLLTVFPLWCKSHVFLNSCKDDEKLLQTTRLSAKKLRQRLQDVFKSDKTMSTVFKKSVETQPIIWKRFHQIWSANRAFFQCIPPFLTSENILKTNKRPVVLNLSTQHWIGFDMDHTLINYDNAAVTRLIYDAALSEIIKSKGSSKSHVGSIEKMVNVAHTSLSSISNLKSGSSISQTSLNNDDVVLPNAIQKENSGDDAKAFDSNHISIEAVADLLQSTSDHNGSVNMTISSRQASKRFQCNVAWSQPGLVADTDDGNILSINAQEQVVRVLHGDVVQSRNKWHKKYANLASFEAPRFQRIMTYFDAPVLSVFATLVQAADQISFKLDKSSKELSYKSLWLEAFAAVKISYSKYYPKGWPAVLATPQAYVNEPYHRNVKDWIKLFRSNSAPRRLNPLSTKSSTPKGNPKLFLLTNADFSHANALMSHVYGRFWSSYFDLVVVNAKKSNMRAKASLSKSTNGADSHSIPKHHSGGKDMSVVDVITKKSRRLKDTELKFEAGDQKNEESNLLSRANKAVSIFGRKPINLDAVRKSNEGYINSTSNRPPCVLSGGCMKQLLATLYTYGSSGEDGINVTYIGDHLHTDIEPIVKFNSIKWQTIGILPTLQRFFPTSSCTPTNTGTKPGRKARVIEQLKKQKMQNDNTNKMYLVEDVMNLLVVSDTRNKTEAEGHINSLYSLRSNTGPWAALPADEATWLEYSAQQKAQIILPSVQFLVSCLQSPKTARRRPRSSPSSEVALSMAPSSIIFSKYHTSNSSIDHPPLYLFISGYLDAFLSQYNELGEMGRNPNGFLQRLATLFTFSNRSSATNMSTGNGSLVKLDRSTFVNSSFFSNGWINELRDALPPASQILSEYGLNTSNYTFEHYIVKHCKFVYESAHKAPY